MDSNIDNKRKKDKQDDHDHYKDRRSKRPRSRSRSPKRPRDERRKRRNSRSRSPDSRVKQEKVTNDPKDLEPKKEIPERKTKETDMLNTRTGGAYIPPARLRMMQAQITDKSSVAYQRLAWEALKKSIHGHINKINVGNIGIIIKELLKENIVRGRGLLSRSVIQAQAASPTFTNVYAALVAAVNSRFPNIGELLLKRLVIQFKRGFKRNDKATCISSASFIAHLVNQRVAHEILALELLTLLVESPTDDSVEVAIAFLKECGQKLTEVSSKGVNAIFEMLRNILHEGQLDKRVQYMIEVMFQIWKDGFKDHPALIEELELVPEEEQFTHLLMLDDATDSQDILNVFKFDDKYEENEQKYKSLSKEILGSDAESGEEDESGESGSEESDEEEGPTAQNEVIIDNTETNLVALRRTIYLTINSSLDFEECAHKLMKMQLKPGQEVELCHMFLDCCAEQRTYEKFYGLLAQRFCNINRMYIGPFEEIFKDSYGTAHRLDTNRLRNVSKFFAHLLFTDSISWEVMECVKLNEEDTTSSSRIYIKILFQELAEYMGLKKLNDRLKDPTLQEAFSGIFPRDNPKNTRFSINFFTSIGLGGLTDELREHLKQMPKNVPASVTEIKVDSDSDSESSSSSSSSSDDSSSDTSSSDSDDDKKKKKSKKDKTKEKNQDKPAKQAEESGTDKNKNVERWGHDGFYDTYGKDARRTESRPERHERGRDNFAKPREQDRRNDNESYDRSNERRNYNERRRPDDRNGHADESDRRHRDERSDRRDRDHDRWQNDQSRDERSDRRDRDQYHKQRDQSRDEGSDRRDQNQDHRQNDQSKDERSNRRHRDQDHRQNDQSRDERSDRRYRDHGHRQNDQRIDESSRSRREEGYKEKRYYETGKNEDEYRSNKSHVDDTRTSRRENNDDRSRNKNENRRKDDDSSRNKRDGKNEVESSDEDNRNKKTRNKRDASSDEEKQRSRKDTRVNNTEQAKSKKSKKKSSSLSEGESTADEDNNEKDEKSKSSRKRNEEYGEYKNSEKYNKGEDHGSRVKDSGDKKRKDKRSEIERENYTPEPEEPKDSKRNKDKKKDKQPDVEKKKSKKYDSDREDSDDQKRRKHDKERGKGKENSRGSKIDCDSWDIERRSSVHRELGSRYWD